MEIASAIFSYIQRLKPSARTRQKRRGCSRCVAAAVAAALGGRRGAELGFWLVGEAVDENCGRTCGSGGSHGEIQIGESPPLQA